MNQTDPMWIKVTHRLVPTLTDSGPMRHTLSNLVLHDSSLQPESGTPGGSHPRSTPDTSGAGTQQASGWGLPPVIHRTVMVTTAFLPPIFVLAGLARGLDVFSPTDAAILGITYALSGLGITAGYHRLLAHGAFRPHPVVERSLLLLGALAVQGSPIPWVAHHRKHHEAADHDGDPHTPTYQGGHLQLTRSFWHAHLGWILARDLRYEPHRFAPDLLADPFVQYLHDHTGALTTASFLLPGLASWSLDPSPSGFAHGMFWGGAMRVFATNHVTWAVNSVAHSFGRRRFQTRDRSRNVPLLALISMGEGWHNNHHAYPTAAVQGVAWWELDVTGLVIVALERIGLVTDVVRIRDRE